jgi:hypothetical protein
MHAGDKGYSVKKCANPLPFEGWNQGKADHGWSMGNGWEEAVG